MTEQVVPRFYDRDENGIPRRWIGMIRRAMATLAPKFNTGRMVQEYVRNYYLPVAGAEGINGSLWRDHVR